jgi:hypothetical protein
MTVRFSPGDPTATALSAGYGGEGKEGGRKEGRTGEKKAEEGSAPSWRSILRSKRIPLPAYAVGKTALPVSVIPSNPPSRTLNEQEHVAGDSSVWLVSRPVYILYN